MKKLLLSVFAIAALASCMQDETISQNQQAIDFGTPFVDKATKAIDYSYGENKLLKEIYVYGTVEGTAENPVSIFEHDKVSAGDADYNEAWQCAKTQYWIPGADYKFVAINGMGDTKTDAIVLENGLPKTLKFTSVGQTDLVAGYVQKTAEPANGVVSFTMSHLLSKVKFTVKNTTNENYPTATSDFYYKVTDIKLTNAATSGTCTLTCNSNNTVSGAWTSTPGVVSFGNATNATVKGAEDVAVEIGDHAKVTSHHELLVVPAIYANEEGKKLGVQFTIGLYAKNGDDTDVAINLPTEKTVEVPVEFVAGRAYNFIINVSVGEKIQFTVASNPTWTDAADQTVYQDTVVIE